jgi:hypothetical protein
LRSGQADNSLCEHDRCVGHGRNLTRGAGSCARRTCAGVHGVVAVSAAAAPSGCALWSESSVH